MKGKGVPLTYFAVAIIAFIVLVKVWAAVVPSIQTEGDDIYYYGEELTSQAACENANCYWNATRTYNDCTLTGKGKAYENLTCTNLHADIPLGGLFSGSGVLLMVVIASLLIVMVYSFLFRRKY